MIVSVIPKYIPLVQKPCCCCMACLQMILYRRGYELFDQQELAEYFGVKIGKKDTDAFNIKLTVCTSREEEGIKTTESEDNINRFFKEKGILLTAKAVKASEVNDLENFLISNLRKNNDLWIEYSMDEIHKERGIHDGLIESIVDASEGTKVVLIDPLGNHKPRIEVDTEKIQAAITAKLDGRDMGFIVISKS